MIIRGLENTAILNSLRDADLVRVDFWHRAEVGLVVAYLVVRVELLLCLWVLVGDQLADLDDHVILRKVLALLPPPL